jgi:hypothetical protein
MGTVTGACTREATARLSVRRNTIDLVVATCHCDRRGLNWKADLAERQMEFSIGVNLGDMIVNGEQHYGDGIKRYWHMAIIRVLGPLCNIGRNLLNCRL